MKLGGMLWGFRETPPLATKSYPCRGPRMLWRTHIWGHTVSQNPQGCKTEPAKTAKGSREGSACVRAASALQSPWCESRNQRRSRSSKSHLDGMFPCPCPAAGEASGETPTGTRGMWAGGGHTHKGRCALPPGTCSVIQSQHHGTTFQSQRPSRWGTGYPLTQVPSWCQRWLQGEMATFRGDEVSKGFEHHLLRKT